MTAASDRKAAREAHIRAEFERIFKGRKSVRMSSRWYKITITHSGEALPHRIYLDFQNLGLMERVSDSVSQDKRRVVSSEYIRKV
jgi:hypothetical protein